MRSKPYYLVILAHTKVTYDIREDGDPGSGRQEGFLQEQGNIRKNLHFWTGICGDGSLIGPFFFDANINGESYRE